MTYLDLMPLYVDPRRALRDASGKPVVSSERQRPAKRALSEVAK